MKRTHSWSRRTVPVSCFSIYEYEPHATVAAYGNMLHTKADLHTE